jgi:hypothetical protein
LITEINDVALVEEEAGPARSTIWCFEEIGSSLACAGDEYKGILLGYGRWSEPFDIDLADFVLSSSIVGLVNQLSNSRALLCSL